MNFTEAEIIFLDSEKQNGITSTMDSSAAYVRNLDRGIKEQYEAIYKRTINPKFTLCYWCGNEVFAMVRDVHKTYNMYKAHEAYKAANEVKEMIPDGLTLEPVKVEKIKTKK